MASFLHAVNGRLQHVKRALSYSNHRFLERSFILRAILLIGFLFYRVTALLALMVPISQDVLRGLMAKGDSTNPELLALLQELAPSAISEFVMPRYPLYEVYKNRLGLNWDPSPQDLIALDITEEYYEGMIQTVKAMAASSLANIRFLQVECLEGDCSLFVEENLKEVLGIIYFPHKFVEDKHH